MRLRTKAKKIGSSLFILLPKQFAEKLKINENDEVEADIRPYFPAALKILSEHKLLNKPVSIEYGDIEVSGEIISVDNRFANIFNKQENKNYIIELSLINKIGGQNQDE
jgi:hypothetical protein